MQDPVILPGKKPDRTAKKPVKTGLNQLQPVFGKTSLKSVATYVDRFLRTNLDKFVDYTTTYHLKWVILRKVIAFKLMYVVILQEYSWRRTVFCKEIYISWSVFIQKSRSWARFGAANKTGPKPARTGSERPVFTRSLYLKIKGPQPMVRSFCGLVRSGCSLFFLVLRPDLQTLISMAPQTSGTLLNFAEAL